MNTTKGASRKLSGLKVTPEMRRNNVITAVALLGCVGAVYYNVLNKMKQTVTFI